MEPIFILENILGTHLNKDWGSLQAPQIAINYWNLPKHDASWLLCLKHILADEAHHRDVNHALASLPTGADNPFIGEHIQNFDKAAVRRTEQILKNTINSNYVK